MSHPSRVRGLKQFLLYLYSIDFLVAPFTGAWIETISNLRPHGIASVAPFTGAWIETNLACGADLDYASHPSRVRGLKRNRQCTKSTGTGVAPFTGAWIETMVEDLLESGNE